MLTVCWGAKGGSGTTVVAAALAISIDPPCLLVDLAGDVPLALGLAEPGGPGVADWSRSSAPAERLDALRTPVAPELELLHRGRGEIADRWAELGAHLAGVGRQLGHHVIVDAGSGSPPPPDLHRHADRTLLVTRPCYLAVTRASRGSDRIDGVVLVDEPGRALDGDDVATSIGAPVVARILLDPAIARAVDSGLLLARLPRGFRHVLAATA